MSNIVINESPITSAIKAVPNALSTALQAKAANDQNAWNKQMQMFEYNMQRDAQGMNAGGYQNQEIMDYFGNLALGKGKLVAHEWGGLDWTGSTGIPTKEDAKAKYKQILNAQGKRWHPTQDEALFGQLYSSLLTERHNRVNTEIDNMLAMGYSEDDITDLMKYNPQFKGSVNTLINELPDDYIQFKDKYRDLLPTRDMTIVDRFSEDPLGTALTTGGVTALGSGAWNLAHATSDDIIKDANQLYRDKIKGSRDELRTSRKWLAEAKQSGNKDDMKVARKMVKDAQKNVSTTTKDAEKLRRARIKENTNLKRFTKNKYTQWLKSPAFRGALPFIASSIAEPVGKWVGGDKGGTAAKTVVGVSATAPLVKHIATRMGMGQFILNRLKQQLPAAVAKKIPLAALDGPIPAGDAIAILLSAGSGALIIKDAMSDWRRYNRRPSKKQKRKAGGGSYSGGGTGGYNQ